MDKLTVSDYQQGTSKTAIYSEGAHQAREDNNLLKWSLVSYCGHGLSGEAGELVGNIKKALRDDAGIFTQERQAKMQKELGDIGWYVSQICNELGWDLDEVLFQNLAKLASRQDRGVLTGSGDDR